MPILELCTVPLLVMKMTNATPNDFVFERWRENALYDAVSFVKMQMERNQWVG
jgi:hypothetical protein